MNHSDQDLERIEEIAADTLSPDFLREVFESWGMSDDQIANALQIADKMLSTPGWADKLLPLVQGQRQEERREERQEE